MTLIEMLIALAFFPPLLFCLCLMFLVITWHQTQDRQEEEESYAES